MTPKIPKETLREIAQQRNISTDEFETLYLAWSGSSHEEIAGILDVAKITVRKRLERVYSKFEVPGETRGKFETLKKMLVAEYEEYYQERESQDYDWGEAPIISDSNFYGRTEELATLKQWIVDDTCRLVAVFGMGGIGKTALVRYCAEQIKDRFEFIIWKSLATAPSLNELLNNILMNFSDVSQIPVDEDAKIAGLIDYFQKNRCLLILDGIEVILKKGDLTGSYQETHAGYKSFLINIGQIQHRSCVLITSQEVPRPSNLFNQKIPGIRSLTLERISTETASQILSSHKLEQAPEWDVLIKTYNQTPLTLNRIALIIKELFNSDVKSFIELTRDTIILDDLDYEVLEQQYDRLSKCEQAILKYLTRQSNPISLKKIVRDLTEEKHSISELTESMNSLKNREGFLEIEMNHEITFTPNLILKKYIERKKL